MMYIYIKYDILEPDTFHQMAGIVSDGWGNCIFLSCKGQQIMVADENGTPMCIAEVKVSQRRILIFGSKDFVSQS